MKFEPTPLHGAFLLKPEWLRDKRGAFARTMCLREMNEQDIDFQVVQSNISVNNQKCTLRGMHFQLSPYEEAKLIHVIEGTIYDVIIDLRQGSTTYKKWYGVELSAGKWNGLYVPKGFAHGYLTLTERSVILYQMSDYYQPDSASGVRWDDPAFGIKWPAFDDLIISTKDKNWPLMST